MKRWPPKVVLPVAVLLVGMLGGVGLVAVSPSVETATPEPLPSP